MSQSIYTQELGLGCGEVNKNKSLGGVIDKRRTEIDSLHDVIGRGFSGWIYIYP